jgi:hypothetical protein
MIRMGKIIDIIRENINLCGVHLYFPIVDGLIWKKIIKLSELFFNGESWHGIRACVKEFVINDP